MTDVLVTAFHNWLIEEEKAEATCASYMTDVTEFITFVATMSEEKDSRPRLTRYHVLMYKHTLEEMGRKVTTINKKLNSLRVFNLFLMQKGHMKQEVVHLKKDRVKGQDLHQVSVLSKQQEQRLLAFVEDETEISQRNRLIIHLLLRTGIRVSELTGIRHDDIDLLHRTLTVKGKGAKYREIPLRQDVLAMIQAYQRGERADSTFRDSPFLFVSQRAAKMHRDAVYRMIQGIGTRLGMPLHPHLFRHTFASRLLAVSDLAMVAQTLGHHSVNMSARYYIGQTRAERQATVEKL